MKNSEIISIGEIPINWSIYKNKYLFNKNKVIVGEKHLDYDLLSLTTKGIKQKDINSPIGKLPESFSTYQEVVIDDIVLCLFDIDVSAVFSGKSNFNGMISSAYSVYRCNDHIEPNFAAYWFNMIDSDRKYIAYSKSLRNTINADTFKEILTAVPLLPEQQAIADYLDKKYLKLIRLSLKLLFLLKTIKSTNNPSSQKQLRKG